MASDPIKELRDLILSERLPRDLTGPRQSDENSGRDWFGHFAQIKASCREIALASWDFVSQWFDSWLRVVLTGCVTGGIIGFVWRLMVLPN
jgi:hypothetical protein